MTTYVTSDLHFGHKNIIKYCNRPFASVEEMDETLIANWNKTVSPNDTIWILGDFSFHKADQTAAIIARLNGYHHMIMGNHDRGWGKGYDFYRAQMLSVDDYLRLELDSHKFVLCHFPFASWERGYVNLHGHTHGQGPKYFAQLDVGVDSHSYTPISVHEAYALSMKNKKEAKYH